MKPLSNSGKVMIILVTIRDVAKLAGVSQATVSRVLNGTAGVDPEKEKRVINAVNETGFKPNEVARSLFRKSSRIIGYVVPSILNLFLNEIGRAIEDEAFQHGFRVILCNTDEKPEKESLYINMLSSMNADGAVIISNNNGLEAEISSCGFPVVVLDQKIDERYSAISVQCDNYQGGYLAAEHLVQCGCRKIVQMRGPQKYISGVDRFRGYLDVCEKYGIEPRYVDSNYDFESGLECARKILSTFPDADGILASSDMTALSFYKILCQSGRRVPEDVMIVGYDNVRLSTLVTPEFTTVAQPMEKIGRLAVQLIADKISGQKEVPPNHMLPVELKARQTTTLKDRTLS